MDNKVLKKSLIWTSIYVGVGTLSLFGIMNTMPFYSGLFYIGILFCLPVDIISAAILFTEGPMIVTILIVQSIMFVLMFLGLCFLFSKIKNK
jgi:hypothetical protein